MTLPDWFPPPPPRTDSRYHGLRCDLCLHFDGCTKTPRPDQTYCAFNPPKFERKESA